MNTELRCQSEEAAMQAHRSAGLKFLVLGLCAVALAFGQPAPVAQTGQKTCYDDDGGRTKCKGTGQDAEFQYGVEASKPRFKVRKSL